MLTSGVIERVPLPKSRDGCGDLEGDYSTSETDSKPSSPSSQTSDPLSKFQFSDLLPELIVPHDDFVRRVEWTTAASEQKDDIRAVKRYRR